MNLTEVVVEVDGDMDVVEVALVVTDVTLSMMRTLSAILEFLLVKVLLKMGRLESSLKGVATVDLVVDIMVDDVVAWVTENSVMVKGPGGCMNAVVGLDGGEYL